MQDEPRWRRPSESPAAKPDVWSFCRGVLDRKVAKSGRSPETSCEIDVGSRWGAAQWFESRPPGWERKFDDYPDLPDGDIEPIGYSFEVMVHDQYLLRRGNEGGYLVERRRRAVLSPRVIAETS